MSIRRSLAFSFLEKYASTAINLASTLVLARLLSPAEIGVFSVGAAVVGVMQTMRDFGITNYLIQEREIDDEKLRTAFTVTLGLSWFFAGVLLLGSGWAAEFYREEGVRQIVWVMAANFLLIPFGSPILALMRRELQFGRLASIQLTATAVNAVTAVLLAATGHGFMSLAWASLAGVATTSGLAFLSRPHAFLFRPGVRERRSVLSFGSFASGNALIADLRTTAPDLILGRTLGFEAVGLYSRAIGLIAIFGKLFFDALQPVLLPALAEKVRRGEDLREPYLRAMAYVTVVYWPFFLFLGFMAAPIIHLLLGDQWLEAAPLVRFLCVSAMITFPAFIVQSLQVATGRVRDMFIMNLILTSAFIAMIWPASLHSIHAAAFMSVPFGVVFFVVSHFYIRRIVDVSLCDYARSCRRSGMISLLTIAPFIAATSYNGGSLSFSTNTAVVTGALVGIIWLAGVIVTRHPVLDEFALVWAKLLGLKQRHTPTAVD